MPRRTPYVTVNLTVAVRDELQRRSLQLSARVGRRLTLSAVVGALLEATSDDALEAALAAEVEEGE